MLMSATSMFRARRQPQRGMQARAGQNRPVSFAPEGAVFWVRRKIGGSPFCPDDRTQSRILSSVGSSEYLFFSLSFATRPYTTGIEIVYLDSSSLPCGTLFYRFFLFCFFNFVLYPFVQTARCFREFFATHARKGAISSRALTLRPTLTQISRASANLSCSATLNFFSSTPLFSFPFVYFISEALTCFFFMIRLYSHPPLDFGIVLSVIGCKLPPSRAVQRRVRSDRM